MTPRIDPRNALPDEIVGRVSDGVPFPAFYVGPLYTGNGGAAAAQAALDAELRDLRLGSGDEPAPAARGTDDAPSG